MTHRGVDYTFQVNYGAHSLLTRHLLSAGSGAWPRRIVNVTSVGHHTMCSTLLGRPTGRTPLWCADRSLQSGLA
jgi:hypothetical protein